MSTQSDLSLLARATVCVLDVTAGRADTVLGRERVETLVADCVSMVGADAVDGADESEDVVSPLYHLAAAASNGDDLAAHADLIASLGARLRRSIH